MPPNIQHSTLIISKSALSSVKAALIVDQLYCRSTKQHHMCGSSGKLSHGRVFRLNSQTVYVHG